MKIRSVANILSSKVLDMGGTKVKQPLPTVKVDQISPFLLLHHFGPSKVGPGQDPLDVGPHPHRGFEPVTFLYSGGIRHKDSQGNEGVLEGGDVQWMTAGRGIIHSERASKPFLEKGGTMEGIQLWVNLPKKDKMAPAHYQDIKSVQIPSRESDGVEYRAVAGEVLGMQGPAKTFTPILVLQIRFVQDGTAEVPLPSDFNAMVYILNGKLASSGGFDYPGETLLHFKQDGTQKQLAGEAGTRALLLAGAPIEEPMAHWGPYVMNTQTEIMEAMRDYQMGKMGFYVD